MNTSWASVQLCDVCSEHARAPNFRGKLEAGDAHAGKALKG